MELSVLSPYRNRSGLICPSRILWCLNSIQEQKWIELPQQNSLIYTISYINCIDRFWKSHLSKGNVTARALFNLIKSKATLNAARNLVLPPGSKELIYDLTVCIFSSVVFNTTSRCIRTWSLKMTTPMCSPTACMSSTQSTVSLIESVCPRWLILLLTYLRQIDGMLLGIILIFC